MLKIEFNECSKCKEKYQYVRIRNGYKPDRDTLCLRCATENAREWQLRMYKSKYVHNGYLCDLCGNSLNEDKIDEYTYFTSYSFSSGSSTTEMFCKKCTSIILFIANSGNEQTTDSLKLFPDVEIMDASLKITVSHSEEDADSEYGYKKIFEKMYYPLVRGLISKSEIDSLGYMKLDRTKKVYTLLLIIIDFDKHEIESIKLIPDVRALIKF